LLIRILQTFATASTTVSITLPVASSQFFLQADCGVNNNCDEYNNHYPRIGLPMYYLAPQIGSLNLAIFDQASSATSIPFTLDDNCHLVITDGAYAGFAATQPPPSSSMTYGEPIQFNNVTDVGATLVYVTCEYSGGNGAPGSLNCMNGIRNIQYVQEILGSGPTLVNSGAYGSLALAESDQQYTGWLLLALNVVLE